jgi:hypothetical protein
MMYDGTLMDGIVWHIGRSTCWHMVDTFFMILYFIVDIYFVS